MIALLRKNTPWILGGALAGLVVLVIVLAHRSFVETWVLPPESLDGLFHAGWICGALLGVVAGSFDGLVRAREHLLHRAVSARAAHASRVVGCALVLCAWFALVPVLVWGVEAVFGSFVEFLRPQNSIYVWIALAPAATAAAIGLLTCSLPFAPLSKLFCGAALFLAVFACIDAWVRSDAGPGGAEGDHAGSLFALVHVGSAVLIGAASFAVIGVRRDPDRPLQSAARILTVGLSGAAMALLVATGLGAAKKAQMKRLFRGYPDVVQLESGRVMLAMLSDERHRKYLRVDEEHRVLGPIEDLSVSSRFSPDARWSSRLGFAAPAFAGREESGIQFLEERRFLVWTWDASSDRGRVRCAGKGDRNEPFSDRRVALFHLDDADPCTPWALERSSGMLWRLDAEAESFAAVELPQGDRLVAPFISLIGLPDESRESEGEDTGAFQRCWALFGERGKWLRRDGAFEAAPPRVRDVLEKQAKSERAISMREPSSAAGLVVLREDVLIPHVLFRDIAYTTVLDHRYVPRTSADHFAMYRILALGACQPPLLALASHLFAGPGPSEHYLVDPLVAGGRRLSLVLAALGVGVLTALVIALRMRRLGADRRTHVFWIAFALALGPFAFLWNLLHERPRAWSRGPASDPMPLSRIASAPAVAGT